jgi:hypothetical protein
MIDNQILFGVVVVPAVIGLVQVAKDAGVPSRLSPLVAVFLGVLAALAQLYAGRWQWVQAAVIGVALGLSAVGLYSGTISLSSLIGSTRSSAGSPPTSAPYATHTP